MGPPRLPIHPCPHHRGHQGGQGSTPQASPALAHPHHGTGGGADDHPRPGDRPRPPQAGQPGGLGVKSAGPFPDYLGGGQSRPNPARSRAALPPCHPQLGQTVARPLTPRNRRGTVPSTRRPALSGFASTPDCAGFLSGAQIALLPPPPEPFQPL